MGTDAAIIYELDHMSGDTAVIMMTDESDDCAMSPATGRCSTRAGTQYRVAVRQGAVVIDYPALKLAH